MDEKGVAITFFQTSSTRVERFALRAVAALVVNIALFALQLHLTDLVVASQHGIGGTPAHVPISAAGILLLPYPVINRGNNPSELLHAVLVLLAAVQTATLFSLWKLLPRCLHLTSVRVAIGVSALAMLGFALFARSLTSFDVYAYAGYAKLGFAQAYAPTLARFPNDFATVNTLWGLPQVPCLYGPIWLAIERLAAGWTNTLGQAIFNTRIIGIFCVIGSIAALRCLNVAPIVLVLAAVNPAIDTLYVVNAHNDLLGVIPVLLALAVATTAPLLAAVLVACAGLIKASLIVLALVLFRGPGQVTRRILSVVVAIAIFAIGSGLFGHAAYLADLRSQIFHLNAGGDGHRHPAYILSRLLMLCAAVVLILTFVRGTILRSGSWPLFMVSGINYPWYFIWGLPYAVLDSAGILQFFIALPLVVATIDSAYRNLYYQTFAMAAMLAFFAYELARRRMRGAAQATPPLAPL